jgi:hypothetical protein
MSVIISSVAVLLMIAIVAFMIRHDHTNVEHLRSFTPICPNCGLEIRATNESAPSANIRLRDHFKECEL